MNKRVIKILFLFSLLMALLIIGSTTVNATTEVKTPEQLQTALGGKEYAKVEGNTVTLLQDVLLEDDEGIYITDGKYNFNFGDYSIKYNNEEIEKIEPHIILKGADVEITIDSMNSIAIYDTLSKAITINGGEGDICIENTENITINDGEFWYSQIENAKNFTINGGIFDNLIISYAENLVINNGEFYDGFYLYESNFIINNGTFKHPIYLNSPSEFYIHSTDETVNFLGINACSIKNSSGTINGGEFSCGYNGVFAENSTDNELVLNINQGKFKRYGLWNIG